MMKELLKKFGKEKILETGILTEATLDAYASGRRMPRPVTVIAVAQALGEDWTQYV